MDDFIAVFTFNAAEISWKYSGNNNDYINNATSSFLETIYSSNNYQSNWNIFEISHMNVLPAKKGRIIEEMIWTDFKRNLFKTPNYIKLIVSPMSLIKTNNLPYFLKLTILWQTYFKLANVKMCLQMSSHRDTLKKQTSSITHFHLKRLF